MLFGVGRGDDFEDEVCFKRGRVVTPRLPDLTIIYYSFNRYYTVYPYLPALLVYQRLINYILKLS